MDRSRYDATGFQGRVERTRADSEPWWPAPTGAGKGAPNIVIVYMDDMGYPTLAASARRSRRRTSTRWPRAGCASITTRRIRSARRRAPRS